MSAAEAEMSGVSVVLLGSFNPRIFQPAWFAHQGLLSEDEAESAEVSVIHAELVHFTSGWLELTVLPDRFSAGTTQEPTQAVRDLVIGTFTLLEHTPIQRMGLNKDWHLRMSKERMDRLGDELVPPSAWHFLDGAEVATVTMQGRRSDSRAGYVRVKLEPSVQVIPGVYIQVNNHVEWDVNAGETAARQMVEFLRNEWEPALGLADELCEHALKVSP